MQQYETETISLHLGKKLGKFFCPVGKKERLGIFPG